MRHQDCLTGLCEAQVITFLVVATVIFFVVVLPMQAALAKYYVRSTATLHSLCPVLLLVLLSNVVPGPVVWEGVQPIL